MDRLSLYLHLCFLNGINGIKGQYLRHANPPSSPNLKVVLEAVTSEERTTGF